jgi:hypothetical protein
MGGNTMLFSSLVNFRLESISLIYCKIGPGSFDAGIINIFFFCMACTSLNLNLIGCGHDGNGSPFFNFTITSFTKESRNDPHTLERWRIGSAGAAATANSFIPIPANRHSDRREEYVGQERLAICEFPKLDKGNSLFCSFISF